MVTTEKKVKILIYPEKCTGCRVCQLECSFKYHKVFNPALANLEVWEIPENVVSYLINYKPECIKCGTCANSCVYGALKIAGGEQ